MGYWKDTYGCRSKEFVEGVLAAIDTYAIWYNGNQYIGTRKIPIKDAMEEVKKDLLEGYKGG